MGFKPKSPEEMGFVPKLPVPITGARNGGVPVSALAPTATMGVFLIQAKGYEDNVVQAKGYVQFAKSHVPFGPNWTFAKLKPKGTRKMLFGPKGTYILQKVTYSLPKDQK